MLAKAGDETIVESILRAYQLFIHICGANDLVAPRYAMFSLACTSSCTNVARLGMHS